MSDNGTRLRLSLVICTHNPNLLWLKEGLAALQAQTIPQKDWELLLIDNASTQPLAGTVSMDLHPCGRVIREERLGLTYARLCGIEESKGELIVFLDDDNILAPDFLENAIEIARKYPAIGVFGGQVFPRYVEPPPEWIGPYQFMLALREIERDAWGNLYNSTAILPCGAGLCVRCSIGAQYLKAVESEPLRLQLDRRGASLSSAGDTDIALTALKSGMGIGQFTAPRLTHIIPPERTKREYLLRLWEAMTFSGEILKYLYRAEVHEQRSSLRSAAMNFLRSLLWDRFQRRMARAEREGRKRARIFLDEFERGEFETPK